MARSVRWIDRIPWLARFYYFFPIQLLLVQLKKNPVPLVFWLIMFGFVTGKIAANFGVPLLFLDPEYQDEVGFVSYAIIGFACGGFIMAYQISSYIHNAYRFPFLATAAQPFLKYCINNFMIPLLFQIVYVSRIVTFLTGEPISTGQLLLDLSGYFIGNALFILGASFYFFRTDKTLTHLYSSAVLGKDSPRVRRIFLRRDPITRALTWKTITPGHENRDRKVETYLASPWRIRRARPYAHYDKELLNHVFHHNHRRAVVFELGVIATLLLLGLFREVSWLMIPSGACIFLLFTLYLMFTGILYTWFRGWSNAVIVGLLILFNWTHQFDLFDSRTRAYGMNYSVAPMPYNLATLRALTTDAHTYRADSLHLIGMLNNWRSNQPGDSLHQPKLVLLNCSGGGLRSALWTFRTMQELDSLSTGKFMPATALICGSSGGMLGAAYMRELWLRQQTDPQINCGDASHRTAISSDILNPMSVSIAVNDWFIPLQHVTINNQQFSRNRAYAFEQELLSNTHFLFDKRLSDYQQAEQQAKIPMMVFAPTIAADGRKLLISAQPISWMTQATASNATNYPSLPDGVEFMRLFAQQGAADVRFTTVLRMNATFPYITPLTELPSDPVIEVMDAGMRDNFGMDNSLKFLHTFRKWIAANTSGVILVQTRDRSKCREVEPAKAHTSLYALMRPMGSFYGNLFSVQNYNQNSQLNYARTWLDCPLDVIDFELEQGTSGPVSLSWHLTQREKLQVINAIHLPENRAAAQRFLTLLQGAK